MHKIRPVDVEKYQIVKLTQPLLRCKIILTYEKIEKNRWKGIYKSDSSYHLCPFTGDFKHCVDCEHSEVNTDGELTCTLNPPHYNTQQVTNAINDCYRANLEVQLIH